MSQAIFLNSSDFNISIGNKTSLKFLNAIYWVAKVLPLKWLKPMLIKRLNKRVLGNAQHISSEILETAKNCSPEDAKLIHNRVKKILFDFREVVSVLETNNFYGNGVTEKIATQTLNTFYDAEMIVRHKAYENNPPTPSDELTTFATNISINTLSSL